MKSPERVLLVVARATICQRLRVHLAASPPRRLGERARI